MIVRNHAVANGYHYKTTLELDGKIHIECVDNWMYTWGQYYADRAVLYETLPDALKSLRASRRVIVMPDGTERAPLP